jgi:hypothetical protein
LGPYRTRHANLQLMSTPTGPMLLSGVDLERLRHDGVRKARPSSLTARARFQRDTGIVADWPGPSSWLSRRSALAAHAFAGRCGSVPNWKSMSSRHMRCMMIASLRATATQAFLLPTRLVSFTPQARSGRLTSASYGLASTPGSTNLLPSIATLHSAPAFIRQVASVRVRAPSMSSALAAQNAATPGDTTRIFGIGAEK